MLKLKNSKIKSNVYILLFFLGIIACGYMFYFLSYVPAKEQKLNDVAISTIRNIRQEIVDKELHYKRLLQTSFDLDSIMRYKDKSREDLKEFNNTIAKEYVKDTEVERLKDIILKSDVQAQIKLLDKEVYSYSRTNNKKSDLIQIDPNLKERAEKEKNALNKIEWTSTEAVIKNSDSKYEKKVLQYITISDCNRTIPLDYVDAEKFVTEVSVFKYNQKTWDKVVKQYSTSNKVNGNIQYSLSDTTIADNYRDKTLNIVKPNRVLIKKMDEMISHHSEENNITNLFTLKDGLQRNVIISKPNNNSNVNNTSVKNDTIYGMVHMDDFMRGVTQSKLYDCVFLFDSSSIFFSDNIRILSQQSPDSIAYYADKHIGIDIRKANINGKSYMQFTAPIVIGNESFHVSGLIDFNDYRAFTKGVPFLMLIFMLLIALFLISIVPSVKIFVISQWERLKLIDVSFTGVGLILGVFVFTMLLVSTSHYYQIEKNTETRLNEWAMRIDTAFQEELNYTLNLLDSSTFGPVDGTRLFHEMAKLNKDGSVNQLFLPYDEYNSWVNPFGPYFTKVGKNTNLSSRQYFYSYGRNTNYKFNPKLKDSATSKVKYPGFFVESVYSRKRGKKEGVVSIFKQDAIDKDVVVRIMSTDLKSVMQRNTPIGYQYAIVDRAGKILFSSDREKNGLRHIFQQSDNSGTLRQAIENDMVSKGTFDYGRKSFVACIRPITAITSELGSYNSEFPLFVMTYIDESILTWNTSTASFMVGSIGLLIILLFITLRGGLWVMRYRDKDGPLTPSSFSCWLNPKSSNLHLYRLFIMSCIPALVVLLTTAIVSNIEGLIVAAVMNVFYITGMRYAILGRPVSDCNSLDEERKVYKRNIILFWMFYALVCIIIAWQYGLDTPLLLSVFSWYVLGLLFLAIINKSVHNEDGHKNNTNTSIPLHGSIDAKRTYQAQLALWVITLVIVPIVIIAYHSEKLVTNTYAYYAFSELLERTDQESIQFDQDYKKYVYNKAGISNNRPHSDFDAVLIDHTLQKYISNRALLDSNTLKTNKAQKGTLPADSLSVEPLSGGSFSKKLFGKITGIYQESSSTGPVEHQAAIIDPIPIQSFGKLSNTNTERILVLFIVALLVILIFGITTHIYTERIFFTIQGMLQKKLYRVFNLSSTRNHSHWDTILNHKDQKRLLLIGPPTSNRKAIIHSMLDAVNTKPSTNSPSPYYINFDNVAGIASEEFKVEDFKTAHSSLMAAHEAYVIANWHSFDTSGIELENKLNLLLQLLNDKTYVKKRFILLGSSTLHQLENYVKSKSFDKSTSFDSRIYFTYFKSIFRGFHEFILPIQAHKFQIEYESVFNGNGATLSRNEKLLIEAQHLAPSYSSLWNSLSREEKFVLYDLADDGLVNPKNWETLMLLKQKGIIEYTPDIFAFTCFNESFSFFVRQSISQEEALEMENLAKQNGSWRPVKFILIIIVIAMFGLVYNFNPSVLQGFLGIIGAIATAITAFGRITEGIKMPFIKGK